MARGSPGAFGGKLLTSWPVWLGLSAVFLLGLIDVRRPVHDLDARPARPPLVRRLARLLQPRGGVPERGARRSPARAISSRVPRGSASGGGAAAPARPALAGLGARRRDPLPRRVPRRARCREPAHGDRRRIRRGDRRRPDHGRTRAVRHDAHGGGQAVRPGGQRRRDPRPDPDERALRVREPAAGTRTVPFAYLAYVPAVATLGWSGKWDHLPAAHATAIAFDVLVLLGLVLVGRRLRRDTTRRRPRVRVGGLPRSRRTR